MDWWTISILWTFVSNCCIIFTKHFYVHLCNEEFDLGLSTGNKPFEATLKMLLNIILYTGQRQAQILKRIYNHWHDFCHHDWCVVDIRILVTALWKSDLPPNYELVICFYNWGTGDYLSYLFMIAYTRVKILSTTVWFFIATKQIYYSLDRSIL